MPEPRKLSGSLDSLPTTPNRCVSFKIGSPTRLGPAAHDFDFVWRKKSQNVWFSGDLCQQEDRLVVELYDLTYSNQEEKKSWVERARWMKYEEDVEGYDHHYGKPHVPCLFFDNIIALKAILMKATHLLEIETPMSFSDLITRVGEYLEEEQCAASKQIIELMKLKQIHAKSRKGRAMNKSASHHRIANSQSQAYHLSEYETDARGFRSIPHSRSHHEGMTSAHTAISMSPYKHLERSKNALNKIEEAAHVFTGECPEMVKARLIIVRFKEPASFPEMYCGVEGLVESLLPVRFFLFLLGPPCSIVYHQMGRSISTMLANQEFKQLAETASNGEELAQGLDNFMNECVVFPPGEIDSKRLIHTDEIKRVINEREHQKNVRRMHINDCIPEEESSKLLDEESPSLESSDSACFQGIIEDFKNRIKFYWSDITDGLCIQAIAPILFMFFACIAPVVTFGGLMPELTGNQMGMTETLLSQAICGLIWGFFAAQPLIIVAATGPVLIFEGALATTCKILQMDFLTVRLYTGVFVFFMCLCVASVNGHRALKYVTLFIEDIFSVLISGIFIYESCKFLKNTYNANPVADMDFYYKNFQRYCLNSSVGLNKTEELLESDLSSNIDFDCLKLPQPNVSLLAFVNVMATFLLAMVFKNIKGSTWFMKKFRNLIGDFGVAIALAVVSLVTYLLFNQVQIERLHMIPFSDIQFSEERPHGIVVIPKGDHVMSLAVAFVTSALLFILLFVETEITEGLLAHPERQLNKGSGMSYDLVLVGLIALICSIFGLPWMCAAAVQSLAHCSSLTITEKSPVPGRKDVVTKVIEQRVTTIVIALLIGVFAFIGSNIQIPVSALFGVFLYLGFVHISQLDLATRVKLFFFAPKNYPKKPYCMQVKPNRMHLYTAIQLLFVTIIFALKQFAFTAVMFPLVLVVFIVLRHTVLPCIFTRSELESLDGENTEEIEEEECSEVDVYAKAGIPV